MSKDIKSPTWKYFLVPSETSNHSYYIKREKLERLPIEKKIIKPGGMFSAEESRLEDPNIEWLTNYEIKWSPNIRAMFSTETSIDNFEERRSCVCIRFSAREAEEIIKERINSDVQQKKVEDLKKTYPERLKKFTREVPPYKSIKE